MDCVQTMQQASVNKSKLNIIYTILVILYPLLSMYSFFGTMLSIADACAIFVTILMVMRFFDTFTINRLFLGVSIFIFFHTLLMFLVNSSVEDYDTMDLFGTTMRLLLVYFILSMAKNHFVFDFGKKLLVIVSLLATAYLFVQLLLSFGGVYVEGGIPFLTKYAFREDVAGYVEDVAKYGLNYRPRSFFEEPAHFCQYTIVAVALLMFDENTMFNKKTLFVVFLALGIIFSMSLLGWVALLLIFLMWFFFSVKNRKYLLTMSFVIIVAPIVLAVLWNTTSVQNVIADKFLDQNVTSDARFAGISIIQEMLVDGEFVLFFGNGLVATDTYYNGALRLIFSFGLLGILITILMFICSMRKYKNNLLSRVLLLLLFILSFGSEIIFGKYILIYLAFLEMNLVSENHQVIVK